MKIAVITGGNKGLGLAQTRTFLSEGCQVHVVARSEGDLGSLTGDVHFHAQDLSNWSDTSYLDAVHERAGRIDILVNNAGMHLKKPVWEIEARELEARLDINLKALFAACGQFVRLQWDSGGAIVNISSMGGLMALPSAAAYVTSKTAVIGLTRSVAVDAAEFGIRCNAVCPGFIDTQMTRAVLEKDPARRDKIEGRIPGGKFGTPQDVADAVWYLASDQSKYVNGVALPVDGGYSIGF
ncbi:SDR family NAD(P)-dependent oxidoreductase [Hoeflea prorocentri]|uniref:SDR family NAD(P)-dependent oxidoreductase n=1 Tax=Hoeflea prorocentri TaxID=1922333 RepID=A0A9X3UEU1_9HYPH|nr:SDR family oxidoreductase [Hoeflea prorocentri]MCY6379416.1 SDR family NAD(P)-dependent oxidoreductase [Hoeflea prorocentri]MDA5397217.1 SDR family NAD(P)-dependent oxidoreductase [Hoeflea prorocentri]